MKDKNTSKSTSTEDKKLTYLEAVEDLARIIKSMENSDLNMDELSEKVNAATKRLDYCQKALHEIEQNVTELIKAHAPHPAEKDSSQK
ncbi:MAG: exodeoxyribonuclease VII small subunit [Prevotellaceae bacterium]|jgi:exodeoxyribonuclease VII small subunit|nr:exodeoxyribonuclease VII small subunit [Prevotellaceae bacterium]